MFFSSLISLNSGKRREELLLVGHQNHAIYQRISSRQSEYRRQLWLDDWEKAEHRRHNISRYPRWPADQQVGGWVSGRRNLGVGMGHGHDLEAVCVLQRSNRRVKFAAAETSELPSSSRSRDRLTD